MLVGDLQQLVHAPLKSAGIVFPKQVVEEHAQGIDSQALGPTHLHIDAVRIEGLLLPHFNLVDGVALNIIGAHHPRLARVPIGRDTGAPLRSLSDGNRGCEERNDQH